MLVRLQQWTGLGEGSTNKGGREKSGSQWSEGVVVNCDARVKDFFFGSK